jgi:hypothetical protein
MTKRWSSKAYGLTAAAVVLSLFTVACGGEDDDADDGNGTPPPNHLEIAGTWGNPDFFETDVIDDTSWATSFSGDSPFMSTSSIETFDNTENYLITLGEDGKYSRIVWTEIDGAVFYNCTVDFGLDTLEDAEASEKTADASDPENGGCSAFPWTKLTRQ